MTALGHVIEPVADARAYMASADAGLLADNRAKAQQRVQDLLTGWRQGGAPDLWFTYHSYYKAPDLLGPAICATLAIPYVVAEASDSQRRATGEWADHVALARASFGAADVHLCFTERDRQGIAPFCADQARIIAFPPFITLDDQALLVAPERYPDGPVRLVTVAMMRPGVKHESYLALASALARLRDRDWQLTIIGDGPMRADIEAAFAIFPPERLAWRGALAHEAVIEALRGHDIFVWPGLGEAYGLVYLEAQAMGLPVVAYASGGVPATVSAGRTALLAPEGDEPALAAALARLLDDAALRATMGHDAAAFVRRERSSQAARRLLAEALAQACEIARVRR